jgi:hypothetical protein
MAIPHLSSERFECAVLELLDGAFAASHLVRDVADAALREEAALDDPALIVGQLIEQLREQGLTIRIGGHCFQFDVIDQDLQLIPSALPVACQ